VAPLLRLCSICFKTHILDFGNAESKVCSARHHTR
jgi:hypothetical protein